MNKTSVTNPPQFAAKTQVDVDKTKLEIQKMLEKHGAVSFVIGYNAEVERVAFEMSDRQIRFSFPVLSIADTPRVQQRGFRTERLSDAQRREMLEQMQRTRWRELLLLVKAKLVAIQAKITTVEKEFLADTVLPNGVTFNEWAQPYLRHAYIEGKMPPLLPGGEKEIEN